MYGYKIFLDLDSLQPGDGFHVKMKEKKNSDIASPPGFLWEIKFDFVMFLKKLNIQLLCDPALPTKLKAGTQINKHISIFIHNTKKIETT